MMLGIEPGPVTGKPIPSSTALYLCPKTLEEVLQVGLKNSYVRVSLLYKENEGLFYTIIH